MIEIDVAASVWQATLPSDARAGMEGVVVDAGKRHHRVALRVFELQQKVGSVGDSFETETFDLLLCSVRELMAGVVV